MKKGYFLRVNLYSANIQKSDAVNRILYIVRKTPFASLRRIEYYSRDRVDVYVYVPCAIIGKYIIKKFNEQNNYTIQFTGKVESI